MIRRLLKKYWLVLMLFVLLCSVSRAQPAKAVESLPFPVMPVIARYEYAPMYFSQWIENHPQYSMIEVIFSSEKGDAPQIMMTEKDTYRKIFYSNSELKVKALQMEGKEAYLTKVDFKSAQTDDGKTSYGLAFVDKAKQPILWRIFPASAPSELGAGLTPLAKVPGLRLDYRDIGTAVGEGTAIQIGDKMIEAQPWKEISSPPHFVAYHGSITLGKHIGALITGSEKWQLTARPDELKSGKEWSFKDEKGNVRAFKITTQNNDELIISEINKPDNEFTTLNFVVHNTTEGFIVKSLTIKNNSRDLRISFSPGLPMSSSVKEKAEVAFTIDEGKNNKVVTGLVSVENQGDRLRFVWQPRSPDWAKSKAIETFIRLDSNGYSIESTQTGK